VFPCVRPFPHIWDNKATTSPHELEMRMHNPSSLPVSLTFSINKLKTSTNRGGLKTGTCSRC